MRPLEISTPRYLPCTRDRLQDLSMQYVVSLHSPFGARHVCLLTYRGIEIHIPPDSVSMSFWSAELSSSLSIVRYRAVSSANFIVSPGSGPHRVDNLYRRGKESDPRLRSGGHQVVWIPTPSRQSPHVAIYCQGNSDPVQLYSCSFHRSLLWLTLSKTFEKYSWIMSVYLPTLVFL